MQIDSVFSVKNSIGRQVSLLNDHYPQPAVFEPRNINHLQTSTHIKSQQQQQTLAGRRKYHCSEPGCNKSFTTSGHLARHNRIHTGEKNFHCLHPGCPSRFSRQDNMMQHYRTHLSPKSRKNQQQQRRKTAASFTLPRMDQNDLSKQSHARVRRAATMPSSFEPYGIHPRQQQEQQPYPTRNRTVSSSSLCYYSSSSPSAMEMPSLSTLFQPLPMLIKPRALEPASASSPTEIKVRPQRALSTSSVCSTLSSASSSGSSSLLSSPSSLLPSPLLQTQSPPHTARFPTQLPPPPQMMIHANHRNECTPVPSSGLLQLADIITTLG
ncbi:hypothetical protein EC973_008457 [Apophysomyces ossiformis]|uniref:C2H2-type domain-containing protein n=1 Tax=Apophysomyces ossiformis TaxID=679940 RepID=A0A8H7BND4_9FUNG|nr:hypothetical protein EC973_008457 [Apophysomyces ossiformis]